MANVHQDFHGALSYGLQFVEEHCGPAGLRDFLAGLADSVYRPLVDALRTRGLEALEDHWRTVFDLEQGEIEMRRDGAALVLNVRRCPALHHMRAHGYAVADHFCEHTRITNEAICGAAGYASSVEYDQSEGRCVQRFWRAQP
jgi:hypothetical protein